MGQAKERIIMGIDPGTNIMGFGVIRVTGRAMSFVAMDELDLRRMGDPFLKLKRIFEATTRLIDTYHPDEIALEAPFYGKNVQSMLKLGRAQGVAMSAALARQIPITEYLPKKVKMAITGNGNASKEQVPEEYIRKQTLVNGERYITQELKDLEHEVLTAHDRDAALEYDLFAALRTEAAGQVTRVQLAASLIAQLDTLCAFAEVAAQNHYCRPEVDESGVIEITAGRHPVVEKVRGDAFFVPNDTHMGAKEDRVAIITGPNMAGKSTYMRQVALIVLMAQVGCFVPAQRAHIGVVDRIFTRIGASDDLAAGQSTFMVEMTEVSELLRCATKNSLLILDEIGRGTSTFDGMSIARAVLEHCAGKLKAKTLFVTHYHELTTLEQELPNVRNYNVAVHARGEDIVFLRKIVPGGADRSYGIEVAKLAGLPDTVLKRAREILRELESQSQQPHAPAAREDQVSLEGMAEGAVADIIRRTQVDALSPLEALNLLYELKSKLQ